MVALSDIRLLAHPKSKTIDQFLELAGKSIYDRLGITCRVD